MVTVCRGCGVSNCVSAHGPLGPGLTPVLLKPHIVALFSDLTSISLLLKDLGLQGLPPRGQMGLGPVVCGLQVLTVQPCAHDQLVFSLLEEVG